MTEEFNIDALPPVELDRQLDYIKKLPKKYKREAMICNRYSFRINYEKLRNWRDLEQRYHELNVVSTNANKTYWSTLHDFHARALKTKMNEVWIINPTDPMRVLVFDGYSAGRSDAQSLINDGTKDPDKRALIVSGNDAIKTMRLEERSDVAYRRVRVYCTAFHNAIEIRLRSFINDTLGRDRNRFLYFVPGVFIIKNEGRQYIITSNERGAINWIDGKLFVS